MRTPVIEKIVINVGLGRLSQMPNFSDKVLPAIILDVSRIAGQKPKPTTAKKSIAGFKLREGATIGLAATLRGKRANDFVSRLVTTAMPRVKDFRGIDLGNIDSAGNLNLGIREHLVFPEINAEQTPTNFGLQITFVVRGVNSRNEAIDFYRSIGLPLKK